MKIDRVIKKYKSIEKVGNEYVPIQMVISDLVDLKPKKRGV